jgi:hypothetical protein
MPGSSGATRISSVGSHCGGGGQCGIEGCVTCRITGIHVAGFLASVGLKLANILIDGGSAPSAVAGAVKWPAVTTTRSRISVPLAKPRNSIGRPASSTRQTMIAPTCEYLLSASTVAWAEMVVDPGPSAMTAAIAVATGVLV